MNIPKIGETITPEMGAKLCVYFGFQYLANRIIADPGYYKPWAFDGASMLSDAVAAKIFRVPNLTEIALKHDLKYAYGQRGNETEKLRADLEFQLEILNDGASPAVSKVAFTAVDIGGAEWVGAPFSWAFASKR